MYNQQDLIAQLNHMGVNNVECDILKSAGNLGRSVMRGEMLILPRWQTAINSAAVMNKALRKGVRITSMGVFDDSRCRIMLKGKGENAAVLGKSVVSSDFRVQADADPKADAADTLFGLKLWVNILRGTAIVFPAEDRDGVLFRSSTYTVKKGAFGLEYRVGTKAAQNPGRSIVAQTVDRAPFPTYYVGKKTEQPVVA
ncbi:MAG: hypothetical protein AB7G06_03510 [Bdellovibrionales bacterium]